MHWKPPGAEAVEFGYHQDIRFRRPRAAYRDPATSYVQTGIAIDPHRRDTGAMTVLPGSHKLGELSFSAAGRVMDRALSDDDLRALGLDPATKVDLVLEPGDLALWHLNLIHGSGRNRAAADRRFYLNGYVIAQNCDRGEWAFRGRRALRARRAAAGPLRGPAQPPRTALPRALTPGAGSLDFGPWSARGVCAPGSASGGRAPRRGRLRTPWPFAQAWLVRRARSTPSTDHKPTGLSRRRPRVDQLVAHPLEHQGRTLHRHEAHARPLHRLGAGPGVGRVVLVGLDARLVPRADQRGRRGAARLDLLRRPQARVVPEPDRLARPVMRAAAGLEADRAGWQVGEELQHSGARLALPQDGPAVPTGTMHLERRSWRCPVRSW